MDLHDDQVVKLKGIPGPVPRHHATIIADTLDILHHHVIIVEDMMDIVPHNHVVINITIMTVPVLKTGFLRALPFRKTTRRFYMITIPEECTVILVATFLYQKILKRY